MSDTTELESASDDLSSEYDEEYFCKKHPQYADYNRLHYGFCIYCVMEGEPNCEEWDGWGDVAMRACELAEKGYLDAKNGMVYVPNAKRRPRGLKNKHKIKKGKKYLFEEFYNIYKRGVKMWNRTLKEHAKN